MKCTPFAPTFTRKTLPVIHLVSPTCCFASLMGRQLEAPNSAVESKMVSAAVPPARDAENISKTSIAYCLGDSMGDEGKSAVRGEKKRQVISRNGYAEPR